MTAPAPAFQPGSREKNIEQLRRRTLDVLILGGGINGAGIAHDLKLRARLARKPLRVGLVEQRHFASGTSGRNSQLIHGGLRYLKNLEFGLVREALQERATLLRIAPHLVEPLPMIMPMYGLVPRLYYGAGLWLYDLLAGRQNVGRRSYLSREKLGELEPTLRAGGLHSAAIFYDCRVHSARLVLENIFDAARDGAIIANYVKAVDIVREGDGFRVEVKDTLRGHGYFIRARKVVDARGPWEEGGAMRLVRGSHLVLPRVNSSDNAIAHFGADGRILFIIPWGPQNRLSLVGTTDIDHRGDAEDVRIAREEVEYLYDAVAVLFPRVRQVKPVAAYSSLRPLLMEKGKSATETSRQHKIWFGADGLLHISGGKYTTYRLMSEEAATMLAGQVAPHLAEPAPAGTAGLGGNSPASQQRLLRESERLMAHYAVDEQEMKLVAKNYGVQTENVLGLAPVRAPQGLTRLECAIVQYAFRHEMAQRLADLLFVSTYWGYEQEWSEDRLRLLAGYIAGITGWGAARIEEEIGLVLRLTAFPA